MLGKIVPQNEHDVKDVPTEVVFSRIKAGSWPLLHAAMAGKNKTLCGQEITADWDGDSDCTAVDVECQHCRIVIANSVQECADEHCGEDVFRGGSLCLNHFVAEETAAWDDRDVALDGAWWGDPVEVLA